MGIGIETEFLLEATNKDFHTDDTQHLVKVLARNHNKVMPFGYPQMKEGERRGPELDKYEKWVLEIDRVHRILQAPCE
jgi:hypothetical protein